MVLQRKLETQLEVTPAWLKCLSSRLRPRLCWLLKIVGSTRSNTRSIHTYTGHEATPSIAINSSDALEKNF
jgi:hypothetical protein